MNWILLMWAALAPTPTTVTIEHTMTFEECKARAKRHVENSNAISPQAFCIARDGKAVIQIEPHK